MSALIVPFGEKNQEKKFNDRGTVTVVFDRVIPDIYKTSIFPTREGVSVGIYIIGHTHSHRFFRISISEATKYTIDTYSLHMVTGSKPKIIVI
jgi:hypothetical protein